MDKFALSPPSPTCCVSNPFQITLGFIMCLQSFFQKKRLLLRGGRNGYGRPSSRLNPRRRYADQRQHMVGSMATVGRPHDWAIGGGTRIGGTCRLSSSGLGRFLVPSARRHSDSGFGPFSAYSACRLLDSVLGFQKKATAEVRRHGRHRSLLQINSITQRITFHHSVGS